MNGGRAFFLDASFQSLFDTFQQAKQESYGNKSCEDYDDTLIYEHSTFNILHTLFHYLHKFEQSI